jgi:hypothetical protein
VAGPGPLEGYPYFSELLTVEQVLVWMLRRHVSSQPFTNTGPTIEVDSVPIVFRKSFISMRFVAEAVLNSPRSKLEIRSCDCNLIGSTERQILRNIFQYQSRYQELANFEILEYLLPYAAKVFCAHLKAIATDLSKNKMNLPARAMYTEVPPSLAKNRLH